METLKNLNLVQTETEKWFQSDLHNLQKTKMDLCYKHKQTHF